MPPPPPSTVVLMVDTNPPTLEPSPQPGLPYMRYNALAAWLNAFYARRHDYAFLYYQLVEPGCRHKRWGLRHPSYCKLPAIAAALERFETVVFIDSDSWFAPEAPPIALLLAAYCRRNHPGIQPRQQIQMTGSEPSVHFASDMPFSAAPNCGFMIWRASPRASLLLRLWWHMDAGTYATMHDYEQRTLHWVLAHLTQFGSGLIGDERPSSGDNTGAEASGAKSAFELLLLRPLRANASIDGSHVIHVDHTRRGERLWRLALSMLTAGHLIDTIPTIQAKGQPAYSKEAVAAVVAARMRSDGPEADELRRLLLDAALVVAFSKGERKGTASNLRKVQAFGESVPGPSGQASWNSPWNAVQHRWGRAQAAQLQTRQTIPGDVQLLNASEAALRIMPAFSPAVGAVGLPEGLTLALRSCTPALSKWQTWRASSIVDRHSNENKNATRGTNAGEIDMVRRGQIRHYTYSGSSMTLAAYPTSCLFAGNATSLRDPHHVLLAQMRTCDGTLPSFQLARARIGWLHTRSSASRTWEFWAEASPNPNVSKWSKWLIDPEQANVSHGIAEKNGRETGQTTTTSATDRRHELMAVSASSKSSYARVSSSGANVEDGLRHWLHTIIQNNEAGRAAISATAMATTNTTKVVTDQHVRRRAEASAQRPRAHGGKYGRWRQLHADPARLFKSCMPASRKNALATDKAVTDCESWCRPQLKRHHCRACKCSACRKCNPSDRVAPRSGARDRSRASSSAAAVEWGTAMYESAAAHAVVTDRPARRLCLAAWRGDLMDGAPLTFTECTREEIARMHRSSAELVARVPAVSQEINKAPWRQVRMQRARGRKRSLRQQQWEVAPVLLPSGTMPSVAMRGVQIRPASAPSLCVTAYPIDDM